MIKDVVERLLLFIITSFNGTRVFHVKMCIPDSINHILIDFNIVCLWVSSSICRLISASSS